MEELDKFVSKSLDSSVDNDTLESPKSLLDLPDDLLLPILAEVPLNLFASPELCLEPLRNLRLVCKRFNNITRAKAYYRDVAQASFPSSSALFFFEASEANRRDAIALQNESAHQYASLMSKISDDPPQALRSVILAGVQLLLCLCQRATRPREELAILGCVLDMVEKEQLDLPGILAIRIAIIHMFEGMTSSLQVDVLEFARVSVDLWARSMEELQDELLLAFESALLGLTRNDRSNNAQHNQICLKVAFFATVDIPKFLAGQLEQGRDPAQLVKILTGFPTILKSRASSYPRFKKFPGPDLETLSDIEMHHRIKDAMKQEDLAQEILKSLDLIKIGRGAPLTQHVLPMKPLWYRD